VKDAQKKLRQRNFDLKQVDVVCTAAQNIRDGNCDGLETLSLYLELDALPSNPRSR